MLRADARLIDAFKKNEGGEEKTVTAKLEDVLYVIDVLLYAFGSYIIGQNDILDILHEVNPDAVIAITGLPSLLRDYDVYVDENITIDLEKVLMPFVYMLNDVTKNAAEERSTFVRYADIVDMQPLPIAVTFENNLIPYEDLVDFLMEYGLYLTHPSLLGEQQIANSIMKNFRFRTFGGKLTTVKNTVNNLWPTLMSKVGVTKLTNLAATLNKSNFIEFVKSLSNVISIAIDSFEEFAEKQ